MGATNDDAEKLLVDLSRCERNVWDALVAGDRDADAAALDDDFLGVYPEGFAGKDAHIGQMANGPTVAAYELSDLRVLQLGPDHAVLSYCATFSRPKRPGPEKMYVSSIWKRIPDRWVNVFSQDTPSDV